MHVCSSQLCVISQYHTVSIKRCRNSKTQLNIHGIMLWFTKKLFISYLLLLISWFSKRNFERVNHIYHNSGRNCFICELHVIDVPCPLFSDKVKRTCVEVIFIVRETIYILEKYISIRLWQPCRNCAARKRCTESLSETTFRQKLKRRSNLNNYLMGCDLCKRVRCSSD